MKINEDEQIDDLFCDGLKIIQKKGAFRYGTDAVLLANFAKISNGAKVIDIGTGTGILPILLSSKSKASSFVALEVQHEMAEMAKRSIVMNKLEGKIEVVEGNICNIFEGTHSAFSKSSFDAVVTNPPYKRKGSGIVSASDSVNVSKQEVLCTLEDIIMQSSYLLKPGGDFNMVCHPERLADTVEYMRKYKIEPRELTMVQFSAEKKPVMFLIHGIRGGGKNLTVTPPLIISATL